MAKHDEGDEERPRSGVTHPFGEFGLSVGTGLAVLGLGIGVKAEDPELMRLLVSQAPGVFAALLITIFFLRYLRTVNQNEQRVVARIMKTVQDTHDRCHEVHDRSIAAIDRNTLTLGEMIGRDKRRKRKQKSSTGTKSGADMFDGHVPPKSGPPNPDKTGE